MRFINKYRAQLLQNRRDGSGIKRMTSKDEVLSFCDMIVGTDYFGVW